MISSSLIGIVLDVLVDELTGSAADGDGDGVEGGHQRPASGEDRGELESSGVDVHVEGDEEAVEDGARHEEKDGWVHESAERVGCKVTLTIIRIVVQAELVICGNFSLLRNLPLFVLGFTLLINKFFALAPFRTEVVSHGKRQARVAGGDAVLKSPGGQREVDAEGDEGKGREDAVHEPGISSLFS